MKKTIALVTGGDSGEIEVSLNSAHVIQKHVNKDDYDVYMIVMTGTKWIYNSPSNEEIPVNKDDFSLFIEGKKITFDAVFLAIHGTPGEDGKLQGYFDIMGIPYTCCNQATSVVTFNKYFTHKVVSYWGIQMAKQVFLNTKSIMDIDKIIAEIGLPCFVKPNEGGSSVGITKVKEKEALAAAIDLAFAEDDEVLIEEFIAGTEVTCGVFEHRNRLTVMPLTEIVSKNEFFDYEAKYTAGKADEITPARISEANSIKCKQLSSLLYKKLGCRGVVRFDYIITQEKLDDGTNDFYFLEANTIPGLSEASIVPQQARAMDISEQELFTIMLEEALRGR
ncbi:MAG: D-alanine--D-alanine ligase [Bacteroidales bacterium]|nr:D-alanine--D-alanine ligase [Bacteroidales bacterium]